MSVFGVFNLLAKKEFASSSAVPGARSGPASQNGKTSSSAASTTAAPTTAASVLQEVDARERTIAVHGVGVAQLDALLHILRSCGHVVSTTPSQRSSNTIYVTFSTAHAAGTAVLLQNTAHVEGMRFAVTPRLLPLDEEEESASNTSVQSLPFGFGRDVGMTKTTSGGGNVRGDGKQQAASPAAVAAASSSREVAVPVRVLRPMRLSFLSSLPLSERWLLPFLVSGPVGEAGSRKRGRDD